MKPTATCDEIRPTLFALDEEGLPRVERDAANAHLVACRACCEEMVAERALTDLLGRPRRGRRRLRLPIGLSAAAGILVLVVVLLSLGRTEAYGAIEEDRLALDLTSVPGPVRPLALSNHVEVPTGETRRVVMEGTADLLARGPAMFELDRAEKGWKLVLLRGAVETNVQPGAFLLTVTRTGVRRLGPGPHLLCAEEAPPPAAPPVPDAPPNELMQQGHAAFFQKEDFATAERLYRAALEHEKATDALRTQAGFYLSAALGRQEKHAEAIAVDEKWLEENPKDGSRHYILLFHGIYHDKLGHRREARRAWQTIVDEAPESDLAGHARFHLGGGAAAPAPAAAPADEAGGILEVAPEGGGGVLVVRVGLRGDDPESKAFAAVAETAAKHHRTEVVDVEADLDGLERMLRARRPESVLVVLRPATFDIVLHRRILLLSTKIDEDAFADFTLGYLTASDGEALRALWERTRALHAKGLGAKTWISTAVTSSTTCLEYAGSIPGPAKAAGFSGTSLYWAFPAKDPKAWSFIEKNLPRLGTAGVVTMTGNGDPQGIWLFDDHRNVDRSKHWLYAPERVGHDPDGEMPRITADRFRALKLNRPIVWSGTCHSGAACRVFVEGDIISTFGRTENATVHSLDAKRSLCLALLDAGAGALLVPIGANHGMSVSRETEFALVNGASLGETIKSTWDDVCLAAGTLRLDLPVEGEPHTRGEPIMQGGGANRVLIGDPTVRPFEKTAHPLETVKVENRTDQGFDVVVTWKPGWHPNDWDMFGTDRSRSGRVYTRVDLEGLVPTDRPVKIAATLEATDGEGKPLPYVLTRAEPEVFHGRRYVHLQANVNRKQVETRSTEVRVVFRVAVE